MEEGVKTHLMAQMSRAVNVWVEASVTVWTVFSSVSRSLGDTVIMSLST